MSDVTPTIEYEVRLPSGGTLGIEDAAVAERFSRGGLYVTGHATGGV